MKPNKDMQYVLIVGTILIVNISAWGTHVLNCIEAEQWGFLIAGAIAFPIAIVHGFGIWFGMW